jgi:hypothetical protein
MKYGLVPPRDAIDAAGSWRRFAVVFAITAAALLMAFLGIAYAIDPYDSGRSTVLAKPGVRPQGPRTAAASRGRDQAFNAAIVGNSHVQLLSPERLKAKTDLDFVQLAVPATWSKEHFVLIDWFLRHRQSPTHALVVGADPTWCTLDPAMPNDKPFPFWLFSANSAEYVRGLLRYDMLEELPRRLAYVFQEKAERARRDGYWDYEPDYIGLGYETPSLRARLEQPVGDWGPAAPGRFPVAEKLKAVIPSIPSDTALILVFPPTYQAQLPRPGTLRGKFDAACKAALREAAAAHPRSAVIDWRFDRPENRSPDNYFDQTHYRQPIARAIESDIADALNRLR